MQNELDFRFRGNDEGSVVQNSHKLRCTDEATRESFESTHDSFFDVVVLGSGLVGSSFLLALGQYTSNTNPTFKMAVIDKTAKMTTTIHHNDARAIALSYNSVEILEKLKVWLELQHVSTNIKEVHVSSKGKFGSSRLHAKDQGLSALGSVVDAEVLTRVLNDYAEKLSNLSTFRPDEIMEILPIENSSITFLWKIVLSSGKILITRLLVGADGTNSFIRKRFGISSHNEDYRQQAIVSNVQLQEDHKLVAYERFLSDANSADNSDDNINYDSIALLPFGEKRAKCILITHQKDTQQLLSLSDQEYLNKLQAVFGYRLGRFKTVGKRSSYPLKRMSSETLYAPGWVLLGNAANTLHPLAAQGFNLGLRDAVTLAEVLSEHLQQPHPIANAEILRQYAEKRKSDHFMTGQFTQTLVKRKSLLQLGILASEFIPKIKNKIMHQGLGIA